MDHTTGELFLDPRGKGKGDAQPPSGNVAEATVGGNHRGGSVGSTSIQKGGRYRIPPDSEIYRMFAIELKHKPDELKEQHPEIYEKVIEGIESGEIKPSEDDEPPIEPSDNSKSEAYLTARDSIVVRNMLRGLAQTSVSATDKLIKEYDQLVAMCRPETAVALIKKQLASKNIALPQTPESAVDKHILQTLGWDKGENKLLFNAKLELKTKTPTANGLFSKFCYHEGSFSRFMFKQCQTDYMCMLNWIIIFAFRLLTHEPDKFTDENIVELIQNLHKTLFGDIFRGSADFVSRFVSDEKNTTFYVNRVNKVMSEQIFDDVTLAPLVLGIKKQIQDMSETIDIDKRVRMTKRNIRGGMRDIVTRKRHVEKNTRTRKHKIVTISLNKTRRTKT